MNIEEKKILLVDDEEQILDLLEEILKEDGFSNIYRGKSKREAIEVFHREQPDMIVLDIMFPDGDGYEILEKIRKTSEVPVLFLSALSDIEKQYRGFQLGGDDYLVKPFLPKELTLRLRAILKRAYPESSDCIQLENSIVDFGKGIILRQGEELELTAKEYHILQILYDNKNKIVTMDGILQGVWGEEYFGYENSLMAHIRKIREKIEREPSSPKSLVTIKGLGYKLKVKG